MTKLGELVLHTQQAETTFENDVLWKLADMEANPNPRTDESDMTMLRLYAHTIRGMGQNTDELIAMSRRQESAQ